MNNLVTLTPQVQIVTATKRLVESLLAMNTHNRNPIPANIERLASDMSAGEFFLTASGVGVSDTGVLLDGQNRLIAIQRAGYPPVKFVLATGLSEKSQRVVDRHSKRSLSAALSMHMNITISGHMVALANALYLHKATVGKSAPFARAKTSGLTDTEAANFMGEHGALAHELVMAGHSLRAAVLAALFVYAYHDHDNAIELTRDVSKGINLSEDHPAYRLRLAMDRLKKAQDAGGRQELFKLAAGACVLHARGKTVKFLRGIESWDSAPWKWALQNIAPKDGVEA